MHFFGMTNGFFLGCMLLAVAQFLGGTDAVAADTVCVSAAISLKDVLAEVSAVYAVRHRGPLPQFNFGSSGQLQRQIEEGAPVDLFISAGKKQMDDLSVKGLLVPESRVDLLGNELVLVVSAENKSLIRGFADLARKGVTMSIGQPETVPAGKYGQETLMALRLWNAVAPRIVYAKDVRQVLAYVESGNVDAGLVYRSDTVHLKSAVVVAAAPKDSHGAIVYPAALVKGGRNSDAARKFMQFLCSPQAVRVFVRYHFQPLTIR
jgi:molybdate transport system substrate-binding protein